MKNINIFIFLFVSIFINLVNNSFAFSTFDHSETSGFNKYCYFKDGTIETIQVFSICPLFSSGIFGGKNSDSFVGGILINSEEKKGNKYCHYSNGAIKTVYFGPCPLMN